MIIERKNEFVNKFCQKAIFYRVGTRYNDILYLTHGLLQELMIKCYQLRMNGGY